MAGYKYTQQDFDAIASAKSNVRAALHSSDTDPTSWQAEHFRGALVRLDKEQIEHLYSDE